MKYSFKFSGHWDPALKFYRDEANAAGYSGIDGLEKFAEVQYNAELLSDYANGYMDWSELSFSKESMLMLFCLKVKNA